MKKVLIITYYWPPAGGPGVQRWLKFVKYLREFDIEPVVYVPENPTYPIIDKSFLDEVLDNVRIIRSKIFEPYSFASLFSKSETSTISSGIIKKEENQNLIQKILLFIRGNFFIPDARKYWIKPSVKILEKELQNGGYHAIITTGPPHSLHLIGLGLKERLAIRWIADFRDPWTNIGYHDKLKLTEKAQKKHEILERKVLRNADQLITTSFTTRDEFSNKTDRPVSVITNGYDFDPDSFETVQNDKFVISHIGSLLSGRNPLNLWISIKELLEEFQEFRNDLELRLAGKVSEEVLTSINDHYLAKYLRIEGYVPHEKALQIQNRSSLLLLLEIDSKETRGIIPGKLFEYLASKNPILAIGPEKWDVGKIISDTESGKVMKYSEKNEMKEFIYATYLNFKNNEVKNNSINIEQYHRRALTKKLADLIQTI